MPFIPSLCRGLKITGVMLLHFGFFDDHLNFGHKYFFVIISKKKNTFTQWNEYEH